MIPDVNGWPHVKEKQRIKGRVRGGIGKTFAEVVHPEVEMGK